jgi:SAM-dependent methyltransferase
VKVNANADMDDVTRRRELEDAYWRTSEHESPESNSVYNIVNKAGEAAIFLEILELHRADFERAGTILELGAGQGWASCLVKSFFPQARIIATDVSDYAVRSVPKWERIFGVEIDEAKSAPSDDLAEEDESVDVVFCFAAAHHFATDRGTLAEIHRVLRPGGVAHYFYEPSCPAFLHGTAKWRVMRKRPEVPEDVLIYTRVLAYAREAGLSAEVAFYPSFRHRGRTETFYYAALSALPPLRRLLPCTANFTFRKPPALTPSAPS